MALIGEAGPEAIIPLSRPRRAAEVMAQAGLTGGGNVDVAVYLDSYEIAAAVETRRYEGERIAGMMAPR